MAIAPIEVTLPGLSSFAGLVMDIYLYGAAQNAVPLVTGLALTADTQRLDTYWTTTTAALTGLHTVVIREGTTIRARGFVNLDDTTNVHRVDSAPYIGNIASTIVNVGLQAGEGAFALTIHLQDAGGAPIEAANVGIFRAGDARQGTTNASGDVVFNTNAVTWTTVSIVAIGFNFVTAPIVVVGNMTVTFVGASTGALPAPLSADQVHGIAYVYNEDGGLENGVSVYSQMILPPKTSGVYDSKVNVNISAGGIVTILNMFEDAVYLIWRGNNTSGKIKYKVPITVNSTVNLPPIVGKDE